jgi:hypothetical protein
MRPLQDWTLVLRLWEEATVDERQVLTCTAAPATHRLAAYTIFHLLAWRKIKAPPDGFDGFVAELMTLVSLWPLFGIM